MLLLNPSTDTHKPDFRALSVLIIGNRGGSNIGESFARACDQIDVGVAQIESHRALRGPLILRRIWFRLHDRQPLGLQRFCAEVVQLCRDRRPDLVLALGAAPLTAEALVEIGNLGCFRAAYLTDDPWSPFQESKWFFRALPQYDHLFTPRHANISDLRQLGAKQVSYLPFGFDPSLCPDETYSERDLQPYTADVMFAGGADAERVRYFAALVQAGFSIALYGTYWDRFPETRNLTRGQLPITELPKAIAGAKIALCLVRHANRDGHCMRTFEVPASGGCMLAEDTAEHREILGPDGEAVMYFRTIDEMITRARWLIEHADVRRRMSTAGRLRIRTADNTYAQRLETILEAVHMQRTPPI